MRQRPAGRPRGRRIGAASALLGGGLLVGGAALLTAVLVAPQHVELAYGEMKTVVTGAADGVREEVLDELPTVHLGATGGVAELDRCDGTFTEMTSYEHDDVPAVWAAHNNCSGDVLLPWEEGQKIRVEGSDEVYRVVDIRDTPKTWATIDDIVGLDGSLALQTCFYGEDRMKFVGLEPVDESTTDPAPRVAADPAATD